MELNEYILLTRTTAIYPKEKALEYLGLGLSSEAGEVAGVIKKHIRDNRDMSETKAKLVKELGDTFWYLARLLDELNLHPEDIMELNIAKLEQRKLKNTLKGDGDDR